MPSGFSLENALARLAHEEHLALLDCGAHPTAASYLTWGQSPQVLRSLDELQVSDGSAQLETNASWPREILGGALVQIDYGFPVGPYAKSTSSAAQAQLWPLDYYLTWQPQGCFLVAKDHQQALAKREELLQLVPQSLTLAPLASEIKAAWDQSHYQQCIAQIHNYIRHGDIYQVNLTMPFFTTLQEKPNQDLAIYITLRQQSPAPYSAFFRNGVHSILSHSPERFLSADGTRCTSNPIKGTCKRLVGQEAQQRQYLESSEKDRAELAMIIDLVRNDLGRIAESGSVQVEEQRAIMDLPYVHHAYGKIACTLKPDTTHADLLAASFPAGSIIGAPKIRAMDIIQELESHERGAYCGAFGWLGGQNACELAVAIRTMQIHAQSVRFDAGGGIVIDSQADAEWQELNDKASAMRQSLMEASRA